MTEKAAMTPFIRSQLSKSQKVACPQCNAELLVNTNDRPAIDECGFETYDVQCGACGSMLVGIIDPADDKLLLTISP
jgi:transcription elongation factor Elf1